MQVGLPNVDFHNYKYNDGELFVFENSKRINKLNLTAEQNIKLDSAIINLHVDRLSDNYTRTVINDSVNRTVIINNDGVNWTFKFIIGGKVKEIFLDNYYLEPLDNFVRFLNSLLPEQAQIISFGRDMYLRPDTVIYYLPEFLNTNVTLQDSNIRITDIQCYKKGHLVTEIIDSTILCDCRISSKDVFYRRKYWIMYRLDSTSWKREFYDTNEKVIKVEYVKEILPYQIVKEDTKLDIGNKPSLMIYRFYKTQIID